MTELESLGGKFGYVPNFFLLFSTTPGLPTAIHDVERQITYGGSGLRRRTEELIAFWVSSINRCEYCMASHGEFLAQYLRGREPVLELLDRGKSSHIGAKEGALLDFVELITRTPSLAGREHADDLAAAGFTEDAILAIITVTAYFAFCNRMAQATGLMVESSREDWLGTLLDRRDSGVLADPWRTND